MQNPWLRSDKPIIIAHRGQAVEAPENTIPAYQLALDAGAEMIETDVNITQDGKLVMMHDWYLGRTTDIKGGVHDFLLEDVLKADAGSWFSSEYRGVRVPTTEEALAFAKSKGLFMCFEVKGGNPKRANSIAERLVRLFQDYDALEWAFMSSYFHDALKLAKQIEPKLMLAPERLPDDVEPDIAEALRQVEYLNAPVLQIHHRYLYPDFMKAMKDANVAIWAWPATTEEEILHTIEAKADGIMGDDPKLAVQLLKRTVSSD